MRENARRLAGFDLDADLELARCEKLGIRLLPDDHPEYPGHFTQFSDRPRVLYVRGPFEIGLTSVAVVGTRRASPYGLTNARRIGAELARGGAVVVSGLARGIDTAAHEGALEAGGKSWAVLGTGLARIYPPENERLARRLTLISELPLDAGPMVRFFPMRNRIVACISQATVVIQGGLDSGAAITAEQAEDYGRRVYALPGPVDDPRSALPHHLLKNGAAWIERGSDVLGNLELPLIPLNSSSNRNSDEKRSRLPPEHAKILECLGSAGLTLEEAAAAAGLDFTRLSTIIFELELQRLVRRLPGQRYAQNPL